MRLTYQSGEQPLPGYTLRRALGRGGFGEVYHAVSDSGKEVALKLVQRHLEVELRGVRHCLNLKHPNLVTLYDLRTTEAGEHWIVMEYMAGETLTQLLARHPKGLAQQQTVRFLEGLCAGIAHLHDTGLVHRDLKPGNVFLEEQSIKIGDYGLSKFITASQRSGQTQSVGTVHYMAPEIGGGHYGREIDIYSLGVMLYEMLTGTVPFDGETAAEVLIKHLTAEPDLRRLPQAFGTVVGRMLAKRPEERYSSTRTLLADLTAQLDAATLRATAAYVPDSRGATSERSGGGQAVPGAPPAQSAAPCVAGPEARSLPQRFGAGIRKHPILTSLCVLLTLMALTIPLWLGLGLYFATVTSPQDPYYRREFPDTLGDSPAAAGVGLWLLFCVAASLAACAWGFLWRAVAPIPGTQERKQSLPPPRLEPRGTGGMRAVAITASLILLAAVFGGAFGLLSAALCYLVDFRNDELAVGVGLGVGIPMFVLTLTIFFLVYFRRSR